VVNRPRPAPSEATQCGAKHPQSPVPVYTSQNEKQDGFIEVSSKAVARRSTTSTGEMCPVTSPLAVLMESESLSKDIRGDPVDLPPMDNIANWNVRGLNHPNKQEDVKLFLTKSKIGLVGPMETKVR